MSRIVPPPRVRACAGFIVLLGASACGSAALHTTMPLRIAVHDDVSYIESDGQRIKVDVYQPGSSGRHPAVILLHGSGGIHPIVESQVNRYAMAMAEQGMIAFVLHYFDATGTFVADDSVESANYFRWVRDVRQAVSWVRARPDVLVRQVGLLGHSLGAWLAVGVAAREPNVSRIVLFGAGLEPFLADSIKRLPPTLIFHGARDDVVPLSDATHLADFMRARKMSVQLQVFPGEEHTFSDSAAAIALTRAVRFLAPGLRRRTAAAPVP